MDSVVIDLFSLSNAQLLKLRADLPGEIARRVAIIRAEAVELGEPVTTKAKARKRTAKNSLDPLFRNPDTGKTWAGRGVKPSWVSEGCRIVPVSALNGSGEYAGA